MRNAIKKIAYVGVPERGVADALREYGYRTEALSGDSIFGLARELFRMRPAALHVRQNHLKAAAIAKLLDIPLLVQAGRGDVNTAVARAARMADRTLCAGSSVREALVQIGAPHSSTVVMRSLIDTHEDVRRAATFPPMLDPNLRWVVAASPCDGPDRGHQDLLLAFLHVARMRPKLKLLIAGEGCDSYRLRAQADEAGMLTRVVVHPVSPEQLPSIFARAAAVVAPTRLGSAPDPVPEALAVGAPVVATALGSHPVWIRDGRTGWLVPPRSPASLAARLAQLVDDPEMARRVGHNAQKAAHEVSAPRSAAQDLARCYALVGRATSSPRLGIYLPERGLSRA
jgi:glycosyltransferase involved in cell wall biosynthesis